MTHPLLTCQSLQKPVLDPPFIESHQRVCTYNETRLETVQLPNCSADVDPSYTYPVALRCDCGVCLTSTTECITSVWYAGENTKGHVHCRNTILPSKCPCMFFFPSSSFYDLSSSFFWKEQNDINKNKLQTPHTRSSVINWKTRILQWQDISH